MPKKTEAIFFGSHKTYLFYRRNYFSLFASFGLLLRKNPRETLNQCFPREPLIYSVWRSCLAFFKVSYYFFELHGLLIRLVFTLFWHRARNAASMFFCACIGFATCSTARRFRLLENSTQNHYLPSAGHAVKGGPGKGRKERLLSSFVRLRPLCIASFNRNPLQGATI